MFEPLSHGDFLSSWVPMAAGTAPAGLEHVPQLRNFIEREPPAPSRAAASHIAPPRPLRPSLSLKFL